MAARRYESERAHEAEIDRSEAQRREQRRIEQLERENARLRATVNALSGSLQTAGRVLKPYLD